MTKAEKKLQTIKAAVYKKFGVMGKIRPGYHDRHILEYSELDANLYFDILPYIRGRKGIEIVYTNHYCGTLRAMETAEAAEAATDSQKQNNLIEGFWQTMHDHGREAAECYFKDHEAEYKYFGII